MRRHAFTVMIACALAACQSEPEDVPVEEPAVEPTTHVEPGTYEITTSEGDLNTLLLNEDGTYTSMAQGMNPLSGTWAVVGGRACFTPIGVDAKVTCYSDSPIGEDGTWTATPEGGGDPIKVKKISEPEGE